MTAKITTANGKATLKATWIASIPKMQVTIEHFVHGLWDRGQGNHGTEEDPIAWEDLNNQDKIDMWFAYVTMMTLNDAKAYGLKASKQIATEAEEDLAKTRYGLLGENE